jgi:glyoxylase-like metal-dependent hydrolase (beta-lactamase superfamily II)
VLRAGPLDLHHLGAERVIGVFLLETDDGLALFDCGPASCVPMLKQRLAEQALELGDVRHLLLSHIHLDHAGAAGVLVREHPGLQVHVSEIGAPHLVDPSRLEASARRLYGDDFDRLWGEVAPVPAGNVHAATGRALGLDCFPSPGHASHHVCYAGPDGTIYAGDAAGVRIPPSEVVLPPTPPPDVDVEAWNGTIDELERRAPERLAVIHFDLVEDTERQLDDLRRRLAWWSELVGSGLSQEEWEQRVRAELGDDADPYEQAMPLWQSYAGLARYWRKRRDAAS